MLNIRFSCSDKAFEKLLNISPHKHRSKPYQQFDGIKYVTIPAATPSAKGLAKFIDELLVCPGTNLDTVNYDTTTHYIRPETFIDTRDWKETDYEFYGEPGRPVKITLNNFTSIKSRKAPQYTIWNDGDDIHQHGIYSMYPHALLEIAEQLCKYWHISTAGGLLPLTRNECFSAFMNALGMGYLTHTLLIPKTESISENLFYKSIDNQLAKARDAALTRKTKESQALTPKPFSVKLCQMQFDEFSQCINEATVLMTFATQKTYLCDSCFTTRTSYLPANSYTAEPYNRPMLPITSRIKLKIISSPTDTPNTNSGEKPAVGSESRPNLLTDAEREALEIEARFINEHPEIVLPTPNPIDKSLFVPLELTPEQKKVLDEMNWATYEMMKSAVEYERNAAKEMEELESNKPKSDSQES